VGPQPFVFGVDLDGVCADYTAGFRDIVAAQLGVAPETLPLDRSWDFREWNFRPGDFERFHRIAVLQQRMFRTLPVVPGAPEALWRLSDAGIWIRIITHRLYVNWGHEIAISDTAAWLDTHRLPYRDICFLGAKPEVEADMYVDDAAHNVLGLRELGNNVIVFDQPYNRELAGPRAADWTQVEEIVLDAAARKGAVLHSPLPGLDPMVDRLDTRTRRAVEPDPGSTPSGASGIDSSMTGSGGPNLLDPG